MSARLGALLLAGCLAGTPAYAAADCRQALVLALDVSGSVDLQEYRLQLDGLVAALNDPEVANILLASPDAPVRLKVFEWSGSTDQAVLVPWTEITGPEALEQVGTALARTARRETAPSTALGQAMLLAAQFLDEQPDCWKRTIDISGDGKSNFGPRPRDVKTAIAASGYTINALVIGSDAPASGDRRQTEISELSSYFRAEVIAGPDAFVQTALGFDDYAAAMTLKLKRELAQITLSELQ